MNTIYTSRIRGKPAFLLPSFGVFSPDRKTDQNTSKSSLFVIPKLCSSFSIHQDNFSIPSKVWHFYSGSFSSISEATSLGLCEREYSAIPAQSSGRP
jgi:hypothetical protein